MAIRINFDANHNVQTPVFILAMRNGKKLGTIPARNIIFKGSMSSGYECSFSVYKFENNIKYHLWEQLKNFRLMFCRDWNLWFELNVETDEKNSVVKNVIAKSLAQVELSQGNLYDVEINTEGDIEREDYKPTVLYNPDEPEASLLNRIMQKAPHYKISHVDDSIANIQRTFTFNSTSIYDAFQTIAEEIECLFVPEVKTDGNGNLDRIISVYDLNTYCKDCGYRGAFAEICPKCSSSNILNGYGEDTSIFISSENLAENITYSTNVSSVKNCFKLEAGDDLMTATIVNSNPSGSDYIWCFSEETKNDMSEALRNKIDEYDHLYSEYQTSHKYLSGAAGVLAKTFYNQVIAKYNEYDPSLSYIPSNIAGYPSLMTEYYNSIDFKLFIENNMMPEVEAEETTAQKEAQKLSVDSLTPVAVSDIKSATKATVTNAVVSVAKVSINTKYKITAVEDNYNEVSKTWSGKFTITSYSDDQDTYTTSLISNIQINDDYETFVRQKVEKALSKNVDDVDIVSLFQLDKDEFSAEIKKYSIMRLNSFADACQSCLDVLIEYNASDSSFWGTVNSIYTSLHTPYFLKLISLRAEIEQKKTDVAFIKSLQQVILSEIKDTQSALNFEAFIKNNEDVEYGTQLWNELLSFRREDTYSNNNYISDGLNNAELLANAEAFIEDAKKEIYKSANLQHSISSTLKNLLVVKEFEKVVDHFCIGNWLRLKTDDNIYKLRLIGYEVDFDNTNNITTEFSDVYKVSTGWSDVESILKNSVSMSTSYNEVQHQARKGEEGSKTISGWSQDGLNPTLVKIVNGADGQVQTWDSHGMLFRAYDSLTDTYEDTQIKIINSTIALTTDGWETSKTAFGRLIYKDPTDNTLKTGYGINGEVIVGRLIAGENLIICSYKDDGSTLQFQVDKNGVQINNGDIFMSSTRLRDNEDPESVITTEIAINPDFGIAIGRKGLYDIVNGKKTINTANANFYIDDDGNLRLVGSFSTGREEVGENHIEIKGSSINHYNSSGNPYLQIGEMTETTNGVKEVYATLILNDFANPSGSLTDEVAHNDGKAFFSILAEDSSVNDSSSLKYFSLLEIRHSTQEEFNKYSASYTFEHKPFWRRSGFLSNFDNIGATEININEINGKISSYFTMNGNEREYETSVLSGKWQTDSSFKITDGTATTNIICYEELGSGDNKKKRYGGFVFKKASSESYEGKIINYSGNKLLISHDTSVEIHANYAEASGDFPSVYITPKEGRLYGTWYKDGGTTAITSDKNLKNSVALLQNEYSVLFDNLLPVIYKYNNGTSDRYHVGFIAQDVEEAIKKSGLTTQDFAGFISNTEVSTDTETGEKTTVERCYLRYGEFVALNTNEIQKLKKRVAELEQQLNQMK